MAGITGIGGDKFSGKPSDWPDTKTEIIGWLEACGYSYIAKTGTILMMMMILLLFLQKQNLVSLRWLRRP